MPPRTTVDSFITFYAVAYSRCLAELSLTSMFIFLVRIYTGMP